MERQKKNAALKVEGRGLAGTKLKGLFEPLFYCRGMKHAMVLSLNDVFL